MNKISIILDNNLNLSETELSQLFKKEKKEFIYLNNKSYEFNYENITQQLPIFQQPDVNVKIKKTVINKLNKSQKFYFIFDEENINSIQNFYSFSYLWNETFYLNDNVEFLSLKNVVSKVLKNEKEKFQKLYESLIIKNYYEFNFNFNSMQILSPLLPILKIRKTNFLTFKEILAFNLLFEKHNLTVNELNQYFNTFYQFKNHHYGFNINETFHYIYRLNESSLGEIYENDQQNYIKMTKTGQKFKYYLIPQMFDKSLIYKIHLWQKNGFNKQSLYEMKNDIYNKFYHQKIEIDDLLKYRNNKINIENIENKETNEKSIENYLGIS